ncbi:MAG: cysteine peptidase family C39 domain-containing protein, partial [Rivularia sp. ALOHA_DT_140]|nr:cysteine peptidase family C39 domain-containing protein [Rivularia sp. ALOHA_DT_140]
FREAWTACEFNLGDELTQYNCFEGANADGNVLQIVCRGKVRLLAFDTSLGKEVSIQSLDANQIFGGDNAFCNQYREYRAVASSNGTLAQISLQHLDVWLQLYPALSDYFSQIVKSRQKLIFFKTLTQLRSQNTRSLQKLLPYFLESKVNAGSSLIAACPPDARFWLVDGKISSISQKNRSPVVGESWGYPHPIPGDFISQTDLSLFYLPSKHFNSIAETIPQLRNVEVDLSQEVNQDRVKQDYRVESQKKIQLEDTESEWEFIHEYVKFDNQHLNRRWFRIYPFIQQQSSSDCGAACLAMISQYWGKRFSIKTLRSIARINSMGAELTDLANAAQSLGYKALA